MLCLVRTHARTPPAAAGGLYKDSGFGGVRKERQQSRPELGQDLPYSPEACAATISRHPWPNKRYNPSALDNPKVSIVIPVYNEKSTIDEILRRVLDTPVRKK